MKNYDIKTMFVLATLEPFYGTKEKVGQAFRDIRIYFKKKNIPLVSDRKTPRGKHQLLSHRK
jgi:hypothetical protein